MLIGVYLRSSAAHLSFPHVLRERPRALHHGLRRAFTLPYDVSLGKFCILGSCAARHNGRYRPRRGEQCRAEGSRRWRPTRPAGEKKWGEKVPPGGPKGGGGGPPRFPPRRAIFSGGKDHGTF